MSLFYKFRNILRRQIVVYRFSWSVLYSFFKKQYYGSLLCTILLISFVSIACSDTTVGNSSSNSNKNSTDVQATPGPTELSSLHWCNKPAMVFRDQAAPGTAQATTQTTLGPANGTPTTVNDWNIVKANLGFAVFLPKTLPAGACLLNVSGSLRDPIFGSNFTITYVLPDQSSISLSQAPSRAQSTGFQCSISGSLATNGNGAMATPGTASTASVTPTSTKNSIQLCNGVRDKTNIVFSARGTTADLQQFFQDLQPDVEWMPAK